MDAKLNKYEGMFLMNNSRLTEEAGAGVGRANELFEKHGVKPVHTVEEIQLKVADGRPLDGRITHVKAGRRLRRDEITGDPLPNQPADAELVIRAQLIYPLPDRPTTVTIAPLRGSPPPKSLSV